jgi:hypothetical protein
MRLFLSTASRVLNAQSVCTPRRNAALTEGRRIATIAPQLGDENIIMGLPKVP